MPQAVLSVTGNRAGDWVSSPVTPADDHWTLVDEAYPPGDNTDYVQCNGFVDGFLEEFEISAGPANVHRVTNLNVLMYARGALISKVPAIRIEVYVGEGLIGTREFGADSSGAWVAMSVNVTIDVTANTWNAGPRWIRFIGLDGSAGYGDVPVET